VEVTCYLRHKVRCHSPATTCTRLCHLLDSPQLQEIRPSWTNSNNQIWACGSTLSRPNYVLTYSRSYLSVRSSGTRDTSKHANGHLLKQSVAIRALHTTRSQIQTTSTSVPSVDPTRTSETGDMRSREGSRSLYRHGEANGLQIRRTHIFVPTATTIAGEPDRFRSRQTSRACARDGRTLRHVWSVDNGTRKLVLYSSRRTFSPLTIAPRWSISSRQFLVAGGR
jgi:hypothetical protein